MRVPARRVATATIHRPAGRFLVPRFPVLTTDSAPEDSRETLTSLARRRGGHPLNIHAGMANSPAVINMNAGMSAAIARNGTFDAQTREAIALAVGAENGCGYCQSIHTMTGNLLPAGIGNILGGGLAVAALLGWAYARYQTAPEATPLS